MFAVVSFSGIFLFTVTVYCHICGLRALTSEQWVMAEVERNAEGAELAHNEISKTLNAPRYPLSKGNVVSAPSFRVSETSSLHFSPGRMPIIYPCSLISKTAMDCSSRGLETVPGPLSSDITYLDLHNNLINDLPNSAFAQFQNLTFLNMSSNILTFLRECSFCGLSELRHLDLWNNSLLLKNETYPNNVFKPLQKLVYLWINMNQNTSDPEGEYPDKALSSLVNLKYLYIDGLDNVTFGDGFQNLTRLTNLTLAGYLTGHCFIRSLLNTTFQHLQHLTYLDLSDCDIFGSMIEPGAFEPLTELQVLNVTHNENLEFDGLTKILDQLRYAQLKVLTMQLVRDRYTFGSCLERRIIKHFPKTIEYIDARENNLIAVDRNVIGNLPPALKEMDLSGNYFRFGTYFKDLHLMWNLRKLHLNGPSYIYSLPANYPYREAISLHSNQRCTPYSSSQNENPPIELFHLILPPNLESVDMKNAGLRFQLTELEVDPNNRLKQLTLHGNVFHQLEGRFTGLNHLEYLDLSSCLISFISDTFFAHLTSLRTLKLNKNVIGDFLSNDSTASPFSMLNNLELLNLSSNKIESLPADIFKGLNNLTSLLLSENHIRELPSSISDLERLEVLHLNYTDLSLLPSDVIQHIDILLQRGIDIKVDMSGTPIFCDCENQDFLEWMTTSKAFNHSFLNYKCVNPDSSVIEVKDGYIDTISRLRRKCPSHTVMFTIVALAMLFVFLILIGLVIYRFRWKLRYFYYAAYLYYRKDGHNKENREYEYDVFVSYDHKDESFVREKLAEELQQRGLKLCIHGRDFTAGDYIASNIIKAICKSRKTLVVLTQQMINSYWCKYEIQMANMEAVHSGRRVLVFLLMEKSNMNMCMELRYNISNNTYTEYPDDCDDAVRMNTFWDKLVADLRD